MILTPNKYKVTPETNSDGNASRKANAVATRVSRWLLGSLVAMALLLGGNSARTQQVTGAIAGTVADPAGAKASAGRGGVANGYMTGWVCLTTTSSVDGQMRKSPSTIGHITLGTRAC